MHATRLRFLMSLMALSLLIDFTGVGLILPRLPFWAQHLGANALSIGLLSTVYALAQVLFTPILGLLSDRYGRKPLLAIALGIEAFSLVVAVVSPTFWLLLVARFLAGVGAANVGSAQAIIADITRPEERARGMGLVGASIGLGFIIGPLLSGALTPLGQAFPFWLAAILALLNMLLVLMFVPETRLSSLSPAGKRWRTEQKISGGRGMVASLWQTATHSVVLVRLLLVLLLYSIAVTALETTLPLFTQQAFHWAAMENGYLFSYVGAFVVLMQVGGVGPLVKRWSERSLLLAGTLLMMIGLTTLSLGTQPGWLLISLGLVSFGEGMVPPLVTTLLSYASPTARQGELLGLAQALRGLGRILGPLAAGSVFLFGSPTLPFLLGALLLVCTFVLLLSAPVASAQQPGESQSM